MQFHIWTNSCLQWALAVLPRKDTFKLDWLSFVSVSDSQSWIGVEPNICFHIISVWDNFPATPYVTSGIGSLSIWNFNPRTCLPTFPFLSFRQIRIKSRSNYVATAPMAILGWNGAPLPPSLSNLFSSQVAESMIRLSKQNKLYLLGWQYLPT